MTVFKDKRNTNIAELVRNKWIDKINFNRTLQEKAT